MERSALKGYGVGVKRALKRGVKHAVRLGPRGETVLPRILTYHSVGSRGHEMNVTPEAFRAQMRWLAERFDVVSVEEALAGRAGVALTFDDGYRDNVVHAAPVLREFGMAATVFLVTGRMGGFLDHDRPEESARIMSWDEARAWRDFGFAVGGHTRTHARLSACDDARLRDEIVECGEELARELGVRDAGFAYPFGSRLDFDARAVAAVRHAGFSCGLSNCYGAVGVGADRWRARRIWIDASDDVGSFAAKVDGRLDGLAWLDSGVGIRLRRGVNWVSGIGFRV